MVVSHLLVPHTGASPLPTLPLGGPHSTDTDAATLTFDQSPHPAPQIGATPLYWAIFNGHKELAQLLPSRGSLANVADNVNVADQLVACH